VSGELRAEISAQASRVVANLKKRLRKKPSVAEFNWPEDVFARWHREALYIVAVMRTPHGRPPTFETHVARMEHCGGGLFDLAVPMRRGWNMIGRALTVQVCLREIGKLKC
jgi:hypothetical protein